LRLFTKIISGLGFSDQFPRSSMIVKHDLKTQAIICMTNTNNKIAYHRSDDKNNQGTQRREEKLPTPLQITRFHHTLHMTNTRD